MKKITIFTMQLKTPGGIERFVSTIANMFLSDYEVEIVANYSKPTDHLAFPLDKRVKITYLSSNKPEEISLKKIITSLKWYKIPSELSRRFKINRERIKAFKDYLKDLETDYIITDRALYNSLVGKYYSGKAMKIATDHNFHQNNPKYIKELVGSLKGFQYLVVATKELKDYYQNMIKPVKCILIPNPLPNIPSQKSPLKTKNVISVGRLVPEKDFSFLISAFEYVHQQDQDIKLTIIGDGIEKPKLENLIKTKNLNSCVKITGFLSQNKIANYYYDSSLFVLTSKTEAFALVLTEAMSYGLPCIALARASGPRSHITPKNGVLVTSNNPPDLANQIVKTINDKTKLHYFQKNLDQTIDNYSIKSVYALWQKIL